MARPFYRHVTSKTGGKFGELIEDLLAIGMAFLIVLGIGGTMFKLLKPEGWASSLLGYLWDKSPGLVCAAAGCIAALTLAGRQAVRGRESNNNLPTYAFVVMGLFFLIKLVVTGSL